MGYRLCENLKMEEIQGQDQLSQVSIEELPPEMLQMVLKNLDAPSLFACRLVCRKWRLIATPILHERPETELFFDVQSDSVFGLEKGDKRAWSRLKEKEKSLTDFKECLNYPDKTNLFVQFSLFDIQKWDESIINFLSLVSPIATCLKLKFARSAMEEPGLPEKFRNLLFHETPVLKEFGLRFERKDDSFSSWNHMESLQRQSKVLKLALFPSPSKTVTEENSTANEPTLIKLPKLKVLHVGLDPEDDSTTGIFRDVLKIAPKVERIYYLDINPNDMTPCVFDQNDLLFFLEHGKISTLKNVTFEPTLKFQSAWKTGLEKISRTRNVKLEISSLFKMKLLDLCFEKISRIQNPNEMREAFHLAEQILEGSKNTLEKLYISSLSFPPGFSFPTFTKLSNILFCENKVNRVHFYPLFPSECRSLNIFPVVGTIEFMSPFSHGLKRFFPREDSIPLMPSVHTISFQGGRTKGEDVKIMALLCPNLKTLKNVNTCSRNENEFPEVGLLGFPSFGRAVWRYMKNLESLHLIIDASTETNAFPALDSTFTGISKENCLRLFEESKNEDFQTLNDDPEAKLRRESELKCGGLKVNESILDLPKLKELNIKIQNKFDSSQIDRDAAIRVCMEKGLSLLSLVSQLYAFKLMPGLKLSYWSNWQLI